MNQLVEKLEAAEREISEDRRFTFFALFQREGSENWDLVVAAPWLNADELGAWRTMSKFVMKSLNQDELVQLGRISVLNAGKKFFKEVAQLVPKDAILPLELSNFTFSGVSIGRGRFIAVAGHPSRHMEAV